MTRLHVVMKQRQSPIGCHEATPHEQNHPTGNYDD